MQGFNQEAPWFNQVVQGFLRKKRNTDYKTNKWRTSKKAKRLYEFCESLERDQCKGILEEHGISFESLQVSKSRKLNLLISLLVNGTVEFLDVIGPQLLALSDGRVADVIEATKRKHMEVFEWSLVEYKIEVDNAPSINELTYRCLNRPLIGCADETTAELYKQRTNNNTTLQTWLDIGFGSVAGDGDCVSSFLRWLDYEMYEDDEMQVSTARILPVRRVLEALIYANPDVILNNDATFLGLKINERFNVSSNDLERYHHHWFSPARFILDGKIHGACGHDVLALNMITPFLVECGFTVGPENLIELCRKESIHPAVHSYVQHALTTPKSLQVSCRNALRRHFVGPRIHKYLAAFGQDLPPFIVEFVLLKPLLKCIPKQLLDMLTDKFTE